MRSNGEFVVHEESGKATATEPTTVHPLWSAPFVGADPVESSLTVPGSKSLTNRWLVLAALADGPCRLRSPLHSRDSALMIAALRELGATITEIPGDSPYGPDLGIEPIPRPFTGGDGQRSVDCGLAGTVMRFVPPLAALIPGATQFDGDPHARKRPMGPVVQALRGLGITVDDGGAGALPFTIHGPAEGGTVTGGVLSVDAAGSSQFVTAMLLVGSQFTEGLTLRHDSPAGAAVPSMPHVEMTVDVLHQVGVRVDDSVPAQWTVAPGPIRAFDVRVEQDLSNAGPFLAAAVVTGGTVTVPHWPEETTQGGAHWAQILPRFGATVDLQDGQFTVRGPSVVTGVDLDLSEAGELAPTVAAICAVATSECRLRGIAHLRGHETDRLAALTAEINRLGGDAEETADGLIIRPAALRGGEFRSYDDHRMATAGAVIGLVVDGVRVENIATTAKTLPQFPELWADMVTGSARGRG
ncbi:3-phosphoshikimate 1-carboxyvinyltransferase [Kocuria soli]|uniref:3-phosphoshikimate 1-carboxyvinyltransferase n=1 Tax=Kocuria soli TaxID=2485125 RepID=A0A3N3ZSY8_9MICC|nr:3-phosphoshikimate 1-carboxyvinyltransferase [Kocuria soli]ROZ63059.1 3-phosphoshikimate 1-carboxyvinyltransferase [Kocuria soli]